MASALSFGLGENNELLVSTPAAEKSESKRWVKTGGPYNTVRARIIRGSDKGLSSGLYEIVTRFRPRAAKKWKKTDTEVGSPQLGSGKWADVEAMQPLHTPEGALAAEETFRTRLENWGTGGGNSNRAASPTCAGPMHHARVPAMIPLQQGWILA